MGRAPGHPPLRIFTSAVGGLTQFAAYSTGAVSGEAVVEVDFLPYFDQSTMDACRPGRSARRAAT